MGRLFHGMTQPLSNRLVPRRHLWVTYLLTFSLCTSSLLRLSSLAQLYTLPIPSRVDLPRQAPFYTPIWPATMPGEVIDRPNPQPLPSHLPDSLENLHIELPHDVLDQKACDALLRFRRAAFYIAAGEQRNISWEVDTSRLISSLQR